MVAITLFSSGGLRLATGTEGGTYDTNPRGRKADFVRGAVATLYAAGMIYAGGLKLLLLSAILYALGSILFVLARREQQENTFASAEWLIFAVVVIAASLVFAA